MNLLVTIPAESRRMNVGKDVIRVLGSPIRRTPLARELSERFDEVLVDEYQDTNAAQDALFSALSREEANLFMVGDVKQSILRLPAGYAGDLHPSPGQLSPL